MSDPTIGRPEGPGSEPVTPRSVNPTAVPPATPPPVVPAGAPTAAPSSPGRLSRGLPSGAPTTGAPTGAPAIEAARRLVRLRGFGRGTRGADVRASRRRVRAGAAPIGAGPSRTVSDQASTGGAPEPVRLERRRPDGAGGALAAGAVAAAPRPVATEQGRATRLSLRTARRPRSHRPGDRVSARRRPAAILRPGGPISTPRRQRRAPAPAEWPARPTGPDHHQTPLNGQPSTSRPSPSSPRSVIAAPPRRPFARFAVPPRHRPRPLATVRACPVPLPRPPWRRVRRTLRHLTRPAGSGRDRGGGGRRADRPGLRSRAAPAAQGRPRPKCHARDWSRGPSVSRLPSMPRPWSAVGAVSARVGPSVAT